MDTNLYHEFRNHHSFETVKRLVQNLDENLGTDAAEEYAEHGSSNVESILRDLSWDDLDRTGIRTMREHTLVTYGYERPKVRLYLASTFESGTTEMTETILTLTVGHEIDELLPDTSEQTTVRYVVRADGAITTDPS